METITDCYMRSDVLSRHCQQIRDCRYSNTVDYFSLKLNTKIRPKRQDANQYSG